MTFQYGDLTDYFDGIGYKRLKPVEVDFAVSNEHEFNGIGKFKELLGLRKQRFKTRFIYLSDTEEDIVEDNTEFTWYDARENHPARTEYRLYYKNSVCIDQANPEDLMVLCRNHTVSGGPPSLTVFIAKCGDTVEHQLAWLFGISLENATERGELLPEQQRSIDYFTSLILEKIGITVTEENDCLLSLILERFPAGFPRTREFSTFARGIVPEVDCRDDIDGAIVAWMDSEERAFRLLENHIVKQQIEQGFSTVDDFINLSLSVHNRRKSRAGFALENHLRHLFATLDIRCDYNKITENRSRPDFIFPDITEYHNQDFPVINLTMLGVKTSCKDRWRQVLSEAHRIQYKHLLTLEPGISETQTAEMTRARLQLVVPKQIFSSYTTSQQSWLMSVGSFVDLVRRRDNG